MVWKVSKLWRMEYSRRGPWVQRKMKNFDSLKTSRRKKNWEKYYTYPFSFYKSIMRTWFSSRRWTYRVRSDSPLWRTRYRKIYSCASDGRMVRTRSNKRSSRSLYIWRRTHLTNFCSRSSTQSKKWFNRYYNRELFWWHSRNDKISPCSNHNYWFIIGSWKWFSRWSFRQCFADPNHDWSIYVTREKPSKINNSYRSCNKGWCHRMTKSSWASCRCRPLPRMSSHRKLPYPQGA